MKHWKIYEITTEHTPIHGVMLRGKIRKFAIENNIDLLTENASDADNVVRFALYIDQDAKVIIDFVEKNIPDAFVTLILENIQNPVLSKLKVNDGTRYTL